MDKEFEFDYDATVRDFFSGIYHEALKSDSSAVVRVEVTEGVMANFGIFLIQSDDAEEIINQLESREATKH